MDVRQFKLVSLLTRCAQNATMMRLDKVVRLPTENKGLGPSGPSPLDLVS
jgi:hypothetical protein